MKTTEYYPTSFRGCLARLPWRRVLPTAAAFLIAAGCGSASSGQTNIEALVRSAQLASADGRPDERIAKYDQVLSLRPTLVSGYVGRASCYQEIGDPVAAVHDYDAAIKLSSGDPNLYLLRGTAETQVGNNTNAAEDFKKLHNLSASSPEQLVRAAEGLGTMGFYVDALTLLDDGLTLYSHSWDLHRYRGVILADLGSDQEALAEFGVAIRIAGGQELAQVLADRADFYLLRQEYALAIHDYGNAIALDPGNYSLLQRRAKALQATGNFSRAQADLDGAIGVYARRGGADPDVLAELFIERGRLLSQECMATKALADFESALKVSRPSNFPQRAVIQALIKATEA